MRELQKVREPQTCVSHGRAADAQLMMEGRTPRTIGQILEAARMFP